jgi:hypothetical protein
VQIPLLLYLLIVLLLLFSLLSSSDPYADNSFFSIQNIEANASNSQVNNPSLSNIVQRENNTSDGGITDLLSKPFDEHTIIWIIVSGAIGATITQVSKYIFEHSLPQWKLARATKNAIQKYYHPLLLSAYDLRVIIEELLLDIDKGIVNDSDGYYRLKLLWYFASFLGWYKILQNESLFEFQHPKTKSEAIRNFTKHYRMVIRGMSSPNYFDGVEDISSVDKESAKIPALALAAIGELMINTVAIRGDNTVNTSLINIVEFKRNYDNNPDYNIWFSYLNDFFSGLDHSYAKWNRLVVFYVHICALIHYLERFDKLTYSKWIPVIIKNLDLLKRKDSVPSIELRTFHRYDVHWKIRDKLDKDIQYLGYRIYYRQKA